MTKYVVALSSTDKHDRFDAPRIAIFETIEDLIAEFMQDGNGWETEEIENIVNDLDHGDIASGSSEGAEEVITIQRI